MYTRPLRLQHIPYIVLGYLIGQPTSLLLQQLVHGAAEELCQFRKLLGLRKSLSPLPLVDGGIGDAKRLRYLHLRESRLLSLSNQSH